MKKGFSLVEILIGLITISLIMTAFAPIYTKKINSGIALGDGSKKSKPFPYNPLDPNCTPHENYIDCTFKTPPNVSRISAILISGGGGGGGGSTGYKAIDQSAETTSGYKDISINKYMRNVKITSLSGGGGGGGGGAFKNWTTTKTETITTPAPCSYGAVSAETCHSMGLYYYDAGQTSNKANKDFCLSDKDYSAYNPCMIKSNLPGCKLLVENCKKPAGKNSLNCKKEAAVNSVCEAIRATAYPSLPANIFTVSLVGVPQNTNLPEISTSLSGYGSLMCYYDGSACQPKTTTNTINVSHYTSAGGGSGSMGAKIASVSIPDNIIQSAIGGKIRITAGGAGTGGAKGASNGASGGKGGAGGASSVVIYNSSGSSIWSVSASGGAGGGGGSITSGGTGGTASNSCSGSSCSQTNPAGNNGSANIDKSSSITSSGGGQSGSGQSSGGAGGSATGTSANAGSAGTAGYAKITYDLHYDGAAGGGGGGSTLIHIDNIAVTPNKEYTVRIGGGGKAGSINSNGGDGGESAIWFDNTTCTISGGKGGKAGTNATSTANAVGGLGGNKSAYSKTGGGNIFLEKEGTNGNSGGATIGGQGGLSGGQTVFACGGLQTNNNCSNGSINGETLSTEAHGNIYKDGNYGISGSGGGGGAWQKDNPGTGGKGQNGYVYIYY